MPRRVVTSAWPHTLGVAAVLAVLALLAACTVGPSDRPALVIAGAASTTPPPASSSAGPVPVPPLDKATADLSWSNCDSDTRQRLGSIPVPASLSFQCVRVNTVLDSPSAPGQGTTRIELLKVGTGAIPLLVVNDLDGLPGTLYAAELASQLPADFLRTFALVGMDRRGSGGSDGVHCVPQFDRDQIIGFDPARTNLTDLLTATTDASQQCILALDTRTAALDTQRTAADVETVRKDLGVAHLNAIGHGEGSRVLTTYANRYPNSVGRLVLDGSPDPTLNLTDTAQAKAVSAEAAFTAFATDCANRGNCPLGTDAHATLTALLSQLRGSPLTMPDGSRLTAGTALNAVLAGLADRFRWPALASAIAGARGGDGTALAAFIQPTVVGSTLDPAGLDAQLVSGCNDVPDRPAPAQVTDAMKTFSAQATLFGGLIAQRLLWCAPWQVPQQPLAKPTAAGSPPILVLSTASDPVTPATGTQRTAQQLANGVLVNWLGAGHGALGLSPCATVAAQHFLIDGQVPANPTTCPP